MASGVGAGDASPAADLPAARKARGPLCPTAFPVAAALRQGASAGAERRSARMRTTISLEEVLLQKMAREEQKFALPQGPAAPLSPSGSPMKGKCKGAQPHAWVQEAKDQIRKLKGEKIYEKPASKFAKGVDLPSLGLVLQSDTLEQDFSFAVQPEREKAFLTAELEKERRLLRRAREGVEVDTRLQTFQELPSTVLAAEPFLQFLADKVQEEVKEAQAWQQQQPRERNVPFQEEMDVLTESSLGASVLHNPAFDDIPTISSPAEEDVLQPSTGICISPCDGAILRTPLMPNESPVHPVRSPRSAGSPRMRTGRHLTRALSAAAKRSPSPCARSPLQPPTRPHTAGATLTRLFKDAKGKQEVMKGLLSRREEQEAQLARLEVQEEELAALRQRLERLRANEENQILLPELDAQLQTLEEQRLRLDHLRRALGTPALPSTVMVRKEHLRQAQESAWQLLLESMAHHAEAEAMAQSRSQQRQHRSTQMLWQRQRLNQRTKEGAPPASVGPGLPSPGCSLDSDSRRADRCIVSRLPSQR